MGKLLTFVEMLDFGAYIKGLEVRMVVQAAPGGVAALVGEQEAREKEGEEERQPSPDSVPDELAPPSLSPSSFGWGQQHQDAQLHQRRQQQQFGGSAGRGGGSMEATRLAQAALVDDEEGASSWTVHSGAVMKRIDSMHNCQ